MKKITQLLMAILASAGIFTTTMPMQAINLTQLPTELLTLIALHAGDRAASKLAPVNRQFNNIIEYLRATGTFDYPSLQISPKSDLACAISFNQIAAVFPTYELGIKLDQHDKTHTRKLIIRSNHALYLPRQIQEYTGLKQLHLSMPLDNNRETFLLAQTITISPFRALPLKGSLIQIDYDERTLKNYDDIIEKFSEFIEHEDSIISLDSLIDQLPALERLTFSDTTKHYTFNQQEIKTFQKLLKDHAGPIKELLEEKTAIESI